MHIPDGYLSPATCAATYAAALPFWWFAFRRLEKQLHTRMVPLLAVFSAFSFVVMMFNLPLPGGTTGHATGVAIAAIVLGPWASMVAVSVALLIQAVFFGDGGITTLGANCLNIAVLGSLVAYGVHRLVAGEAAGTKRQIVAAALAGYVAINVAAFVTAIEFGVQPLFFHDASGTPLYAPYPLEIAIPAMMIGHLSIAGLAELVVTAGLVTYLLRAHPELLARSIPQPASQQLLSRGRNAARRLWVGLAALMLLTPLGLLAAGTAWGEWGKEDFGSVLPQALPRGLKRLAGVWNAPIPDYAPAFMQGESLGYVASAALGAGLIVAAFFALTALMARTGRAD